MKPSAFGWIAILFGLLIVVIGALMGGHVIIMGIGFLFIVAGGVTKRGGATKACPHCKSEIDAEATVCPKCTRDVS